MNTYEKLLDSHPDVDVVENYPFEDGCRIKGLYCDGVIALSNTLTTTAERTSILAEEIGHHETSTGNILNLHNTNNSKQEYSARFVGYNKVIGLIGLVDAFEHHCTNAYEVAEHLGVTEEFLVEAVKAYRSKYGNYTTIDNYVIFFNPRLSIMKIL